MTSEYQEAVPERYAGVLPRAQSWPEDQTADFVFFRTMPWTVLLVVALVFRLTDSVPGHVYPWRGSPVWGYFTPPLLQRIPSIPRDTPMDAMVDLTNDLGVAILQDHSYSCGNFAFSPYGVASVLVVLFEGARGESARQIHRAVGFPPDIDFVRIGFRDIHRHLRSYFSHEGYLSGITLNKEDSSLKPEYKKILKFYGYDVDVNQSPDDQSESEATNQTVTDVPSSGSTVTPITPATTLNVTEIKKTTPEIETERMNMTTEGSVSSATNKTELEETFTTTISSLEKENSEEIKNEDKTVTTELPEDEICKPDDGEAAFNNTKACGNEIESNSNKTSETNTEGTSNESASVATEKTNEVEQNTTTTEESTEETTMKTEVNVTDGLEVTNSTEISNAVEENENSTQNFSEGVAEALNVTEKNTNNIEESTSSTDDSTNCSDEITNGSEKNTTSSSAEESMTATEDSSKSPDEVSDNVKETVGDKDEEGHVTEPSTKATEMKSSTAKDIAVFKPETSTVAEAGSDKEVSAGSTAKNETNDEDKNIAVESAESASEISSTSGETSATEKNKPGDMGGGSSTTENTESLNATADYTSNTESTEKNILVTEENVGNAGESTDNVEDDTEKEMSATTEKPTTNLETYDVASGIISNKVKNTTDTVEESNNDVDQSSDSTMDSLSTTDKSVNISTENTDMYSGNSSTTQQSADLTVEISSVVGEEVVADENTSTEIDRNSAPGNDNATEESSNYASTTTENVVSVLESSSAVEESGDAEKQNGTVKDSASSTTQNIDFSVESSSIISGSENTTEQSVDSVNQSLEATLDSQRPVAEITSVGIGSGNEAEVTSNSTQQHMNDGSGTTNEYANSVVENESSSEESLGSTEEETNTEEGTLVNISGPEDKNTIDETSNTEEGSSSTGANSKSPENSSSNTINEEQESTNTSKEATTKTDEETTAAAEKVPETSNKPGVEDSENVELSLELLELDNEQEAAGSRKSQANLDNGMLIPQNDIKATRKREADQVAEDGERKVAGKSTAVVSKVSVTLATTAQRNQRRKKRTIADYLKYWPVNTDLSLQLQNGMYDTHVSRNSDLYRSLPRFPFLVDGAIDTPVPMMSYTNIFPYCYIPRLHTKALEFPLDDIRYKLLILLPMERRGLRQLIYDLADFPLRGVLQSLRPARVRVTLPTFMVEGFVILTSTLQKMGIRDVFDPRRANLSGMSMDPELYVRNIEQSVTVVIRNYVEILDIQTRTMAARNIEFDFFASHPFLYFVLDTATNVALMAGQMLDPLNSRIYR